VSPDHSSEIFEKLYIKPFICIFFYLCNYTSVFACKFLSTFKYMFCLDPECPQITLAEMLEDIDLDAGEDPDQEGEAGADEMAE
jgi:hypothetical protein